MKANDFPQTKAEGVSLIFIAIIDRAGVGLLNGQ